MRKNVYKLFWIWNFDKEEKWLNEMAAKGLSLVSLGCCRYTFEECPPGEYDIRLELLENMPTHGESKQYINFIEETGAEYLGSIFRWVYFRKKKSYGEFNLYSDCNSRIKQLDRILKLSAILLIMNLFNGINNIWLYSGIRATTANLFIGLLCLSFSSLLAYGLIRINNKKQNLKKNYQLFE